MKNLLKRIFTLSLCAFILSGQTGCSADPAVKQKTETGSSVNYDDDEGSNPGTAGQTIDLMTGYSSRLNDDKNTVVSESFRQMYTDFAVRLFQQSTADAKEDNMMISPLSVMAALSMTVNGAEGDTRKQMLDLFCSNSAAESEAGSEPEFSFSMEDFNQNMSSLLNQLPSDPDARLLQANSIWFLDDQERFQANSDFLQTNADYYQAEIYQAPFDNGTLSDINSWVSDHTEQMIPSILDEIPDQAVMYLINALAFDAAWADPYSESDIWDGEFTNEDGSASQVSMMSSEEYQYIQMDHAGGFIKPYAQGYAFAALLPDEDISLDDFLADLTGENLHQALTDPSEEMVETCMPRFSAEYAAELSEILKHMGMELPFDSKKADFGSLGTCPDPARIYISRVIHKTAISVDGNGTRAGAATAVEMAAEGCAISSRVVQLTRPFLYLIIEQKTGIPVFMGTVTDLSAGSR